MLGALLPQHKHCHSMLPPHLKHQILQFIGCFCAADVDVELAGRDDELHNDSHQAPALQRRQTAKAPVLNSIWRDFWSRWKLLKTLMLQGDKREVALRCLIMHWTHIIGLSINLKNSSAFLRTCELLSIRESQQIGQTWMKTFPVIGNHFHTLFLYSLKC